MKIINKTKWDTRHLRAFISEVMKRSPEHIKRKFIHRNYRKRLVCEFGYNRGGNRFGGYVTGRAYLNSFSMRIMVGSQKVDKVDLAKVVAHELAHTLGYTHEDMKGNPLFVRDHGARYRELYAWAETLPLDLVAPTVKLKGAELQELRYHRAQAAIGRWTAKLKRAQIALKKLTRQERYYERALASRKPKETL